MTIITMIQLLLQVGELLCYISINLYVHQHNNKMLNTSVISADTFRMRQRSHMFSMTGQMYHFFAEILYLILSNVAVFFREQKTSNDAFELVLCLKLIGFGILSTFQVVSSSDIREEFFNILEKLF